MKKLTKSLIILSASFCLAGLLLFGIGFAAGGTKYVHATNLNSMKADSDASVFKQKKTKLPSFSGLAVSLDSSDLLIKPSGDANCYIEYEQETKEGKNPLSWSVKDDTLTVKENGNTGSSHYINVDISFLQKLLDKDSPGSDYADDYKNYVTLYLPAEKELSSFCADLENGDLTSHRLSAAAADISLEYGDFFLTDGTFDTITLSMSDGDFNTNSLTAGQANLKLSYGDCMIKKAVFETAKITSDDGDITVKDLTPSGKADISSSYGDVSITLNKNIRDTAALDLKTNYGDINLTDDINGTMQTDGNTTVFLRKETTGSGCLKVESSDGEITVK